MTVDPSKRRFTPTDNQPKKSDMESEPKDKRKTYVQRYPEKVRDSKRKYDAKHRVRRNELRQQRRRKYLSGQASRPIPPTELPPPTACSSSPQLPQSTQQSVTAPVRNLQSNQVDQVSIPSGQSSQGSVRTIFSFSPYEYNPPPPKVVDDRHQRHVQATREATTESIEFLDGQRCDRRTIRHQQRSRWLHLIQSRCDGVAINVDEYKAVKADEIYYRPIYLLCDEDEARSILAEPDNVKHIPMLVYPSRDRIEFDFDKLCDRLTRYDWVDLQISAAHKTLTQKKSGRQAAQLLKQHTPTPVNALNIRSEFSPPRFIANLEHFSILSAYQETDDTTTPGKRQAEHAADLSGCSQYIIAGGEGSISWDHIDRMGVWTLSQTTDGEKLWPQYPRLRRATFLLWARRQEISVKPFSLLVPQGCSLLQPPGTIHFPYSKKRTVMTGWMFWFSRDICDVIKMSLCQLRYPFITNEGSAKEMRTKLQEISRHIHINPTHPLWHGVSPSEVDHLVGLWDEYGGHCCACVAGCRKDCPCVGGCALSCHDDIDINCKNKKKDKIPDNDIWPEDKT